MAQVWLVTGSSRGLGRAIVEAGLAAGNKVLATARGIESLADLPERYGDQVKLFALDVTDEAAAANAVISAIDLFGSLDVVINNAGYGNLSSIEDTLLSEFRAQCPASSILSGQRQLEFPIWFKRYQQQSGLWEKWESRGFCGISKGGGKGGKPAFGFPRFPRPGFFHSPSAAAFLLLE